MKITGDERGLIGVEDCGVRAEERGLAYCVETSTEALLIAVSNEEGLNNVNESVRRLKDSMNGGIKFYMAKF